MIAIGVRVVMVMMDKEVSLVHQDLLVKMESPVLLVDLE